jgi:hypothetical protein
MTTTSSTTRRHASFAAALAAAAGLLTTAVSATPATASTGTTGTTAAGTAAAGTTTAGHARVLDLPNGFRPEGITAHGRTLYASSLADGRILAVDRRTGHQRILLPGVPGRALRGMQVDARTGLLYVTGSQGTTGIVLAVDLRSGRVAREWTVPGAAFLNDLVVTPRAVWVTDSRVDRLTRLTLDRHGRPTADAPHLLPLRGPWPVPDPAGNRANGIRALPGGALLLDHSTAGGLWTVSPADGVVRRVTVTGGPDLTGGDGVERAGDRVWVVRGNGQRSITELRLHAHGGTVAATWVRELTDDSLDVPSTAVLSGGRLWAVNARFGVAEPASAEYWITGLRLGHH